jgi:hypothetical protein
MPYRFCVVCNGSGSLWGTPKLATDQLTPIHKEDAKEQVMPMSEGHYNYGLEVLCWRCLGKGQVPDERQDTGESNG